MSPPLTDPAAPAAEPSLEARGVSGEEVNVAPAAVMAFEQTLPQTGEALDRGLELSTATGHPPTNLPGYRIGRSLGEGKYGSVWLAREQNTGKQVAIKFYTNRRGIDWSLLSREVEKLAVLYTSRNIVGLLAVGWDHDPPYYVMEYLENGSLAQMLAAGPLRIPEAVRITQRVAQALVHAHGSGILHCDLKPANILLDKDLEPRLCDFGQSRLVDEQSHSLGTLFYMAPEQADLKAIPDARWDVYALGALMYQMLCGKAPFRSPENEAKLQKGTSLEERLLIYQRIVHNGPRPSAHRRLKGIDQALVEIVDRCLSANPVRRFPNAQAVLDRLQHRDRIRARRPLIVLGLVLPLLLLAGLTPLALEANRVAISTAQSNLTNRALESDVLSANLLARGIYGDLGERLNELIQIAEDETVRELVAEHIHKPRTMRKAMADELSKRKAKVDELRDRRQFQKDASWFLTDDKGFQRWREPESAASLDEQFTHRDYFHGLNREYVPGETPEDLQPIQNPHISLIYKSTSTGLYSVAISVPVWDRDHDRVLGVLARTVYLSGLLTNYETTLRNEEDVDQGVIRMIALIDSRDWKLLAHPWMTNEHLSGLPLKEFSRLKLDPAAMKRLKALTAQFRNEAVDEENSGPLDRMIDYIDPLADSDRERYGGAWLAAFCPVPGTDWVAVVQERRDAALHPIEQMRKQMAYYGFWALAVMCGLVGGMWWLIVRALQDPTSRLFSKRSSPREGMLETGAQSAGLSASFASGGAGKSLPATTTLSGSQESA